MKRSEMTLGNYYLVNLSDSSVGNCMEKHGIKGGKYIGHSKYKDSERENDILIECFDDINGHNGRCNELETYGKQGHCWFVYESAVIRELTEEEVTAWLI